MKKREGKEIKKPVSISYTKRCTSRLAVQIKCGHTVNNNLQNY